MYTSTYSTKKTYLYAIKNQEFFLGIPSTIWPAPELEHAHLPQDTWAWNERNTTMAHDGMTQRCWSVFWCHGLDVGTHLPFIPFIVQEIWKAWDRCYHPNSILWLDTSRLQGHSLPFWTDSQGQVDPPVRLSKSKGEAFSPCSVFNKYNQYNPSGSAHSPIRRHAVRLLNLQIDVEFATTSSRKTNDWIEPEWRPIHPLTMNNISSSKSIHELIDQLLEKRLHHCDTPSQIPWCCSLMVEIWNC